MKAVKHPLTAEHRKQVKALLAKWKRKLNLDDWRIEFVDKAAVRGAMAHIDIHHEDRLAEFHLAKSWNNEPTERELESTVLHEMLHVRLADLKQFTKGDCAAIGAAEHSVIVILEHLLFPKSE